jgi:hypothetical protein
MGQLPLKRHHNRISLLPAPAVFSFTPYTHSLLPPDAPRLFIAMRTPLTVPSLFTLLYLDNLILEICQPRALNLVHIFELLSNIVVFQGREVFLQILRHGLASARNGCVPIVAVEVGRQGEGVRN